MWATSAHPGQLNGWKQTLWIYWLALRGPTSGTGSHLHSGGPRGPGTSGWRHGSKTIMMRLVWAWAQSPGAIASHPLFFVVCAHSPLFSFSLTMFPFFYQCISLSVPSRHLSPSLLNPDLSISSFPSLYFSSLAHTDSFPGLICISKGAGGSLYQAEELNRAAGWILKHSSVETSSQSDRGKVGQSNVTV